MDEQANMKNTLILEMLASGLSKRHIAEVLGISEGTVRYRVKKPWMAAQIKEMQKRMQEDGTYEESQGGHPKQHWFLSLLSRSRDRRVKSLKKIRQTALKVAWKTQVYFADPYNSDASKDDAMKSFARECFDLIDQTSDLEADVLATLDQEMAKWKANGGLDPFENEEGETHSSPESVPVLHGMLDTISELNRKSWSDKVKKGLMKIEQDLRDILLVARDKDDVHGLAPDLWQNLNAISRATHALASEATDAKSRDQLLEFAIDMEVILSNTFQDSDQSPDVSYLEEILKGVHALNTETQGQKVQGQFLALEEEIHDILFIVEELRMLGRKYGYFYYAQQEGELEETYSEKFKVEIERLKIPRTRERRKLLDKQTKKSRYDKNP